MAGFGLAVLFLSLVAVSLLTNVAVFAVRFGASEHKQIGDEAYESLRKELKLPEFPFAALFDSDVLQKLTYGDLMALCADFLGDPKEKVSSGERQAKANILAVRQVMRDKPDEVVRLIDHMTQAERAYALKYGEAGANLQGQHDKLILLGHIYSSQASGKTSKLGASWDKKLNKLHIPNLLITVASKFPLTLLLASVFLDSDWMDLVVNNLDHFSADEQHNSAKAYTVMHSLARKTRAETNTFNSPEVTPTPAAEPAVGVPAEQSTRSSRRSKKRGQPKGESVAPAPGGEGSEADGGTPQEKQLSLALLMNAYADHFLSDRFAAGHIFTPRGKLPEVCDNMLAEEINGASNVNAGISAVQENVKKNKLKAIFSKTAAPTWKELDSGGLPVGSLLTNCQHDEDNQYGAKVQIGNEWLQVTGDDHYFQPEANTMRVFAFRAVRQSLQELFNDAESTALQLTPSPDKFVPVNSPFFKVENNEVKMRFPPGDLTSHQYITLKRHDPVSRFWCVYALLRCKVLAKIPIVKSVAAMMDDNVGNKPIDQAREWVVSMVEGKVNMADAGLANLAKLFRTLSKVLFVGRSHQTDDSTAITGELDGELKDIALESEVQLNQEATQ